MLQWLEQMPPAAEELVRRAQGLKEEGNELHINKQYEAAVAKYAEAKENLTTVLAWPKAASLTRSCSLNQASCYIQLQDWTKVEEICSSVLSTEAFNLKALYRRGLAYKRQAENIKTELTDEPSSAGGGQENASSRAKSLLELAYKDVGAAHKLDAGDTLVEETLKEVKDAMEALSLDWSSIPIPVPSPQMPVNGATGPQGGAGAKWQGHAGMTAAEARNIALAQAVWKNTSAVREGASALARLNSSMLVDVFGSLMSDGKNLYVCMCTCTCTYAVWAHTAALPYVCVCVCMYVCLYVVLAHTVFALRARTYA